MLSSRFLNLTLIQRAHRRDINSTAGVPASLTATDTALAAGSTAGSSATSMTASTSASSSSRHTIIIAVVASIAGVLVLIVAVAAIIYFGRRRAQNKARGGPRDGVIAPDAAPIDQENPNASGWVEGTWAGDDEPGLTPSSGTRRTLSTGRGKRGPADGSASASSFPNTPSTRSLNKPLPTVSNIQISRFPFSRTEPVSPSSSFGNLGSAPPDSATFLLSKASPPPPVPPLPTASAAAPIRPPRPPESDTFLDMGQSFTDTKLSTLSSHTAHPFATAQSYTPSASGYTRQRSETNTSTTLPPPSASTGALVAATRGNVYTSASTPGPSRKRSGSDLSREREREREHAYARANAPSRQRSGSDTSHSSPYARPAGGAPALRQRSGSDLEVNYGYRGAVPPAPGRKRSGSDLESNYASASVMSPHTYASTLPSTATSPTSMTALVPKGGRATPQQVKEKSSAGSLSLPQSGTGQRAAAAPRRVDPIDPSLVSSRDPALARQTSSRDRGRERERERTRGPAETAQRGQAEEPQAAQPPAAAARSGRRAGLVMSDRERQQFGFLDVPQDASDSRPPSYREGER